MSHELKTTQSNDAIQFVQGISSKNLDNVAITPGTVYFFDDGSIIWDHETNGENKRSTMSGQLTTMTLGSRESSAGIHIRASVGNEDFKQWQDDGEHNWVLIALLNKNYNQNSENNPYTRDIPQFTNLTAGTYELQINLDQCVMEKNRNNASQNYGIFQDVYYSGIISIYDSDTPGVVSYRGIDEILLHRAGGGGLYPGAFLYARLYGFKQHPLQLQFASNEEITIDSMTIKLRKLI